MGCKYNRKLRNGIQYNTTEVVIHTFCHIDITRYSSSLQFFIVHLHCCSLSVRRVLLMTNQRRNPKFVSVSVLGSCFEYNQTSRRVQAGKRAAEAEPWKNLYIDFLLASLYE